MSNNEMNNAVECPQMTRYYHRNNQLLDHSSLHDSRQNYSDDIQVTPGQIKVLETLLRNSVDSNR